MPVEVGRRIKVVGGCQLIIQRLRAVGIWNWDHWQIFGPMSQCWDHLYGAARLKSSSCDAACVRLEF